MEAKYRVTEAEREVLEMLWNYKKGIKQSDLLEKMNDAGKDWKRQTLNTFITRLEEKGLVVRERRTVYPAMSKEEYSNIQIEEVVDSVYGGYFGNLALAFSKKKKLTPKDIEQLQKLVEEYQKEDI